MNKKTVNRIIIIHILFNSVFFQTHAQIFVTAKPQPGAGIYGLLRTHQLPLTAPYRKKFRELNVDKLGSGSHLNLRQTYKMPIFIIPFNGNTIRSSIGMNDYQLAQKIEQYNQKAYQAGIKKHSFHHDRQLWVPYFDLTPTNGDGKALYWGSKYPSLKIINSQLRGNVYYLVSGHGGPDPGAIGRREGRHLCEDEYAYDITLRLARRLLQHQATVYMIIQDPNDGIRDQKYLLGDQDEVLYGNRAISDDRLERLQERTEIINWLYEAHKNTARRQQTIVIHCDSRSQGKRIDIFFYYSPGSKSGKRLAYQLLKKIRTKYNQKQPFRGYNGIVKTRRLYLLTQTLPPAVYIELANIRNSFDQRRLILANNRQAIANWLCQALIDGR